MRVCTLASSSKGNCILVYTDNEKILIDMGITMRETVEKLAKFGIEPTDIDAILLTHEHSDHIKGVQTFVKRYGTSVYCHSLAYDSMKIKLDLFDETKLHKFTDAPFVIGNMEVQAFSVSHDVPKCVGFSIISDGKKFSIATDIGVMTKEVVDHLRGSKLVILEANHDEKRLMQNPRYPAHLKKRILGDYGHLSNINCARTIHALVGYGTKQVMLAHLSEENNTPELAYCTVVDYLQSVGIEANKDINICVAPPSTISPLFYLK